MQNAAFVHENYYLHNKSDVYIIWADEAQRMQDAAQRVMNSNARWGTSKTRSELTELEENPWFAAGLVARNIIDSKGISVKRYFANKVEAYNMANETLALGHAVAAEFGWDKDAMLVASSEYAAQCKREAAEGAALLEQLMNNWDETISN